MIDIRWKLRPVQWPSNVEGVKVHPQDKSSQDRWNVRVVENMYSSFFKVGWKKSNGYDLMKLIPCEDRYSIALRKER